MKITVSAKSLAACLTAVLPAVATRPGLSILSGVRLDASDGGLNVEATDLELTVRCAKHEVAVAAPWHRRSGQGAHQDHRFGRRPGGRAVSRQRAKVARACTSEPAPGP
jgi:hypothetical protein